MSYVAHALREHPELAIFLTLAVGFVVGRISIRSFTLGSVVGTLLAGIVIGQLGVEVPGTVKAVFFNLFLFATGYKVGPQFIRGLGKNALPQILLTGVVTGVALVAAVVAAKVFGYDPGTAAGLAAGAFTNSATIGTAQDAITRLGLPADQTRAMVNNVAIAYAVTYLVGTTGVVWFLSALAPRLLGVDLEEESRKLAESGTGTGNVSRSGSTRPAYREWDIRAYRIADAWTGRSVHDVEESFAPDRVFVQRIRRNGGIVDAEPSSVLAAGDAIALTARRRVVASGVPIGIEVEDRELLEFPFQQSNVVLTNKAMVDRTLEEIAEEHGRGIALRRLTRGGEALPVEGETRLQRGDLLELAGKAEDVQRAGRALGYIDPATDATDIAFVGVGIVVGGMIGLLSVTVGSVPVTLGISGGVLVFGLVFGWLRSVYPTFGRIPAPALWVFDMIGLAGFTAVVGLSAGPGFIDGLRRTGLSLLFVGAVLGIVPQLAGVLFGKYILKMNPVILLGACSGAGTTTPSLRALQDKAKSGLPVLGYTVPYAIASIILAVWGPVIVMLTS